MATETPPGAVRDPDLQAELDAAYDAKPAGYVPRTHRLDGNRARYVNRLIHEPTPYLAQHAHNPVDWWAFGDAALAEAARLGRPIFLSAGYATCHWCHVMEEESFDDEEVAALLNTNFVAIKLDREQRPDIDHFYMLATTLQHRHGGWPNSIWALPDGRPFHTGTYFPKPHFLQVLGAIAEGWNGTKAAEFARFAEQFTETIRAVQRRETAPADLKSAPDLALTYLAQTFNPDHGGFSTGTQFPQEGHLLFLLDHWRRTGADQALGIATKTLDEIVAGGIHDHVGGGFHRYAVDVNWRTPHFEKMLYNQALLLRALAEAHVATGETAYLRAAERLVAYVARDMTAEDGAFFAAEDADSLDPAGKLEEGAFYVWPPEEAEAALGGVDLLATFGLREAATLEAGPVLHLDPGFTGDLGALDPALETLLHARDARPRPLRDEKIILGWNALLIRALAEAGMLLEREDWIAMAGRALDANLARLETRDTLHRIHAGGRAMEAANVSDIAWAGLAATALFDATGEPRWKAIAEAMADRAAAFRAPDGRYALTADGPLGAIFETEDGATPSGESGMLDLLAKLDRREDAVALLTAISGAMAEMPVTRLDALRAGGEIITGSAADLIRRIPGAVIVRSRGRLSVRLDADHHVDAGTLGLAREGVAEETLPEKIETGGVWQVEVPGGQTTLTITTCTESYCNAPVTLTFRTVP